MKTILHFNNLKFGALGAVYTGTAPLHGFFDATPNGFHLYKLDGTIEAFIVANPRQGYFVVSCSQESKRVRYLFSTCSTTEKWLDIEGMGLLDLDTLVQATLQDYRRPQGPILVERDDRQKLFDDYEVIGHHHVYRFCVRHGIKFGDNVNVYTKSGKHGYEWLGSMSKTICSILGIEPDQYLQTC